MSQHCFRLSLWLVTTCLEITIGYRTLTDGNTILIDGTFLLSDTMTNGELWGK